MTKNVKLVSGSSNLPLAKKLAVLQGLPLLGASTTVFADGEIAVHFEESLASQDVVVLQSTSSPIHFHFMELLLLLREVRAQKPRSLKVMLPYYGYSRQSPETSSFLAELIVFSGATSLITVDFHNPISPCLSLSTAELMAEDIEKRWPQGSVAIVAPDKGGITRAQKVSQLLGSDLICVAKKRLPSGEPIVEAVTGSVEGKRALIIDDLVDSGQTLHAVTSALYNAGAGEVHGYATHGLFSGNSLETFNASPLLSLTITDSILQKPQVLENPKIRLLSLADLLFRAF